MRGSDVNINTKCLQGESCLCKTKCQDGCANQDQLEDRTQEEGEDGDMEGEGEEEERGRKGKEEGEGRGRKREGGRDRQTERQREYKCEYQYGREPGSNRVPGWK